MGETLIDRAIEAPVTAAMLVALTFIISVIAFRKKGDSWTAVGPNKWAIAFTILAILSAYFGFGGSRYLGD